MKSFVALLAVVAVVAADVSHLVSNNNEKDAEVLKQDADVTAEGYNYNYETSNGISGQESGQIVNKGREDESLAVQGANSYTAPNGEVISIVYTADIEGYHPQGDHLPTPPPPGPIPDYILRSIEYTRTHPSKPEPGQRA